MAKDDSAYEAYLEEVRSKLKTEDQKAHFEALVSDVGREFFGGHLRESDYYRKLNQYHADKEELKQKEAEWLAWYEENAPRQQTLVAERDALKQRLEAMKDAAGVDLDDPAKPERKPVVEQDDSAMRKEIDALKGQVSFFDKALPRLLKDFGQVTNKIVKEDWSIDAGTVLDTALAKGVDLQTAFNELTAEERDKRAAANIEKIKKDAKEEGRREALKQGPAPDRLKPSGPTIFDTLKKPPTNASDRIGNAVNAWVEASNGGSIGS